MIIISDSLERLVDELAKMPTIGRKTAQRLAMHILKRNKPETDNLVRAILDVKEKIKFCSLCFNITEIDPCQICSNPKRSGEIICVVEEVKDSIAIESTDDFHGKYHILHGAISPLDGMGPDQLKIAPLLKRINGEVKEIILATSPNAEGETTALYLTQLLKKWPLRISRIALGLPLGTELEFVDKITLSKSLLGRREM